MKQLISSSGSLVVGACCLGFTPVIAALTAMGAGFLVSDAILIPLLVVFLGLSVWTLWLSKKKHGRNGPLYTGLVSSVAAFAGLWVFMPIAYVGFVSLVGASVWDFLIARKQASGCAT